MKRISMVLFIFIVLAGAALAADENVPDALYGAVSQWIHIALAGLATAAGTAAVQVARMVSKSLTSQTEATIRARARDIVLAIEEKAGAAEKANAVAMTGAQKLQRAVMDLQAHYPKLPVVRLEQFVLAAVAGAKGVGTNPEMGS